MAVRKCFVAGTKCLAYQTQGSLAMWHENNADVVECVKCSYQVHEADKETREHVRKEEQVIGIFHPDQRCPSAFFKLKGTRLQNSATICATVLPTSGGIMKVAKDLVVSLTCQVHTEDGMLVDGSPVSMLPDYLHDHGSLISGLEDALGGHEAGDKLGVTVDTNDAYGQCDGNLVQHAPKDAFMGVDELQTGMRSLAGTDQGPVPVEIVEVEDDHVVVDGNHTLAGQNLKFNVEVVAIHEATTEELGHGHVYDAYGHDHDHDCSHDGCCSGHDRDHDYDHKCGKSSCGSDGCGCHQWRSVHADSQKKRGNPLLLRLSNGGVASLLPRR